VKRPPRPYRRSYTALVLVITAGFSGCGGNGNGADPQNPSELTGVIVDVQGRGDDVRSFTLQTTGGDYRLRIAPDVDYGFQPSHLRAHENALLPVRCTLQRRASGLYAIAIVDA
jgi:hypothetical protein